MEFYEVVRRRHSVRKFIKSEISDEALLRIIEAGRLAPSGCNLQNREYIVIRDEKTLARLQEKIQPDFINSAATIAVIMDPGETRWGSYWKEDGAAAVMSMLLAIEAEGYCSVWIEGTLLPHENWAKELLGVPEEKRLFILLPIGKRAKDSALPPKASLEEVVHWEKY